MGRAVSFFVGAIPPWWPPSLKRLQIGDGEGRHTGHYPDKTLVSLRMKQPWGNG